MKFNDKATRIELININAKLLTEFFRVDSSLSLIYSDKYSSDYGWLIY